MLHSSEKIDWVEVLDINVDIRTTWKGRYLYIVLDAEVADEDIGGH